MGGSVVVVGAGGEGLGGVVHPDVLILLDGTTVANTEGVVEGEPVVDKVGSLDSVDVDEVSEGHEGESLGETVEQTVHSSGVVSER